MKAFARLLIGIGIVGLAAIATKPGDDECKSETCRRITGMDLPVVKLVAIGTRDDIFWQEIYLTTTDEPLGIACFGHVFLKY